MVPCESVLSPMNPLPGSCVSKRSRCGAVRFSCWRNGLWKLSRGLRVCFRNPLVAGSIPAFTYKRVRGACSCSSGWKIATFKYRRSMRSVLPAAPAGKSQLLSTNVVRGACSCSSGWKIATFKYRRSMRSVLPQLRLENRNV